MRCRPAAVPLLAITMFAISLLAHGGCAAVLPPSQSQAGTAIVSTPDGAATGFRLSTGAHLASATTDAFVPVDIGAGYLYERTTPPAGSVAFARATAATAPMPPRDLHETHGAYLEASRPLQILPHRRAWLGMRTELLDAPRGRGVGASLRVQWEVITGGTVAGAESSHDGAVAVFAHGTVGAGVYLESGIRAVGGTTQWMTSGGLTMRLPFLAGVGIAAR